MAYAFESQLVIDPVSGDKAASASVTVYDANDTGNTAPLALTDMNGNPLANPLTSTVDAFIPPFMADVYKVKLVGGGLTVVAWSGEGLVTEAKAAKDEANAAKDEATVARNAAEAARDAAQNVGGFTQAAKAPDTIITGDITRDINGAATSAPVTWPDGTPGLYTAIVLSTDFPGAVDAYQITYGTPPVKTYTQPLITRDPATGAATNVPAITVS